MTRYTNPLIIIIKFIIIYRTVSYNQFNSFHFDVFHFVLFLSLSSDVFQCRLNVQTF